MPPRKTKLASETGRDAAGLRLDVSIAALGDASFEKEAAGPPAASTRNVLRLLVRSWHAFRRWRQRERLRVSLHDLTERELMDIGLTSGEIDYIAAERTLERLRNGLRYL